MSDVIRDVTIKVAVKTTGDDAFRTMGVEQNRVATGATLLDAKYKTLDTTLRQVRSEIKRQGDEYSRGSRTALKSIDALIAREKNLQSVITNRNRILKEAGASEFQDKEPKEKGFLSGMRNGSLASSPVFKIASAVIAVDRVPEWAFREAANKGEGIRNLFRGQNLAEGETSPTEFERQRAGHNSGQARTEVVNFFSDWAKIMLKSAGAPTTGVSNRTAVEDFDPTRRGDRTGLRARPDNPLARFDSLNGQLSLLEREKSLKEAMNRSAIDSLEKQLQLQKSVEDRLKGTLEREQEIQKRSSKEFGLASKQEQAALLQIGKKLMDKGVGGLGESEKQFAGQYEVFNRALTAKAVAAADANPMYQELRKILGEATALQKAQTEVKVAAELKAAIEVKLSGAEGIAAEVAKRMEPIQKELINMTMKQLDTALQRDAVKRKNGVVPGF